MQTRNFMVDGSYPLKKALLEELALEGLTFRGKKEDYQYSFIAPVMGNDSVTDICAVNGDDRLLYSLPQDYAIAKEAFLAVKEDKDGYMSLKCFQLELTKLVETHDLEDATGIPLGVIVKQMMDTLKS
jgi:hypothetical protein